ncbi:MAG: bifunctional aspartate kinase/homoserine dehydrogenase I [Alphaproteobacteria bacterium]|nr:bifunctional aspartate kinase/homoserine dehydrogenase I [Alphaproteobacteria bacterium]MCB9698665.1 bifunctional aspartate kinase/homoserine dehydrogenase I [Alphaproteobacteria bacterium]
MHAPWVVHKFGGTSLASAERYRGAAGLLAARAGQERQAVVVSAMGGMTDRLLGLADAAVRHEEPGLDAIRARLVEAVDALDLGPAGDALRDAFDADLRDIRDVLRAASLLGTASREATDLIAGYGELWSARTLHALLEATGRSARWLDARAVLVVRPIPDRTPQLRLDLSRQRLQRWLADVPDEVDVLVITGFVASDERGVPTTLGRNGSDYSGAIFTNLLGSRELVIWTDVSGVLSADPRVVPEAVVLQSVSYQEAMELAYFGAKVLHPSTIAPAVQAGAEIRIKNTFRPEDPGTVIGPTSEGGFAVKGFATIAGMSLVNLEGTDMIGVPGIAQRLFGALEQAGVSVVMISQGSSEHSICFVVPDRDAEHARDAIERAFFAERHQGQLQTLEVVPGCCILAAVGDDMAGQVGVAARFFAALGDARVNVRAIAQGSSERNISVVVDGADHRRALRAVHAGFFLSRQTLSIGLVGAGNVGATLLEQFAQQAEALRRAFHLDLRVRAIASSSRMVLDDRGLDLAGWREALATRGEPLDLDRLVDHVNADHLPHAVLVDCTASGAVAARYAGWLQRGIHVVTPNKRANTASMDAYRTLRAARQAHYLYETTVGAGLPVLHTVRDLVQTGDEVERVEGILSGTLSYLFNAFDGTRPFSALVEEARTLGYTEPDPRDDLSGMDVARKLVILAREAGFELELSEVAVEGLTPAALLDVGVDEFLARLAEMDDALEHLRASAAAEGAVLRFVGRVDRSGAAVGLRHLPADHAFARIRLTDNIVQFTTRRYHDNPLVVQGPGAGPEVTAAGVFADLLRLANYLGATR